ncbi:MAG: N-acetyltransferase family protein, partial [Tannerellaceae bacterium]|nr:N-acetyltransferase family protein [Tannerellaceae bacterium]
PIRIEDAAAICRIYNYYIEYTSVSFEVEPVSVEKMQERIQSFIAGGYPYFVAEENGRIVGFANIHRWKERYAYKCTYEVTIYLDHTCKRKRYGTKLYEYLFERIDRNTVHTLIAGITIPNDASIKLHEKFGFCQVAHYKEVGCKFGEWHDVGSWQLIIE